MATVDELLVKIDASTEALRSELRRGEAGVARFQRTTGRQLGAIEKRFERMGASIKRSIAGLGVAFGGVGIARALQQAGRDAANFEKTLSEIVGLVGVSREEVAQFRGEVLKLAKATGRGPQELAEALFFITSAGARGSQALQILEASAKAAEAGLGATKDVAFAAVSAVNAYGEANLTAAQAVDTLVATVRAGNVEASSVAGVLGRVIPIAAEMGVTFNEVGATIAALTRVGASAEEAATSLSATLIGLQNPGKKARDQLEDLGLSAQQIRDSLREENGLINTLFLLREKFGDNEEAIANVFENARSLRGVLSLVGSNADAVRQVFKDLEDVLGVTEEAFGEAADTAQHRMNVALAELKVLSIDIGSVVLPAFAAALGGVVGLFDLFAEAAKRANSELKDLTEIADNPGSIEALERQIERLKQRLASPAGEDDLGLIAAGRELDQQRLAQLEATLTSRRQIGQRPNLPGVREIPVSGVGQGVSKEVKDGLENVDVSEFTNGIAEQLIDSLDILSAAEIADQKLDFDPQEAIEKSRQFRKEIDDIRNSINFLDKEEIEAFKRMERQWEDLGNAVNFTFRSAISNMLLGVEQDWGDTIRRMIADWIAQMALVGIGNAIGGPIGAFISGVTARAHGGPVSRNRAFLVGEQGPELFVPRVNGAILNRRQVGSGQLTVNNSTTINAPGGDPHAISRALDRRDEALVARIGLMRKRGQL